MIPFLASSRSDAEFTYVCADGHGPLWPVGNVQAGGVSTHDVPWQDEMRAFIEDDQIPCYLGGSCSCVDSDDGCRSLIPRGDTLPATVVRVALAVLLASASSALGERVHTYISK